MSTTFNTFQELKAALQVNPNKYAEDGVDHILLSPYGNTFTGKISSIEWCATFDYPGLGKFTSVKNIWFWLTTSGHPDILRMLVPKQINMVLREINARKGVSVVNFKAIILLAKFFQFKKQKTLAKLTELEEKLPWVVYTSEKSGLKISTNYSEWYSTGVKEMYQLALSEKLTGVAITADRFHKAMVKLQSLDKETEKFPYIETLLAPVVKGAIPSPDSRSISDLDLVMSEIEIHNRHVAKFANRRQEAAGVNAISAAPTTPLVFQRHDKTDTQAVPEPLCSTIEEIADALLSDVTPN